MTWKTYKLGEILKRRKEIIGILPNRRYKLVTIKLYHKGVTLRNVVNGSEMKSTMSLVKEGDFILSAIDARNGAFGIVPKELDGAIVTNDFWCLDPDENVINKEFLLFLTSTQSFDYICKQSSDGTTQRIRLQRDKFFNQEIDLPSPLEQKKLVSKLNALKTNVEALSSEFTLQLTLVKQLRQAFLREAVQGKLVPQDPKDEPASELLKKIGAHQSEWIASEKNKGNKEAITFERKLAKLRANYPLTPLDEAPPGWKWTTLIEISNVIVDCHNKTAPYKPGGIPIIRTTNIRNGKLNLVSTKFVSNETYKFWSRRCTPMPRDIVYTREAPVGEAAIIPPDTSVCLGQRTMLIRVFNHLVLDKFILYSLINPDFLKRLSHRQKGATVKHLRVGDVENAFLLLPPLREQRIIVAKLDQLMYYCDDLERSIKQSQIQKEQLLQQVLREALQPKEEYEIDDEVSIAAELNRQ